MKKQHTLKKIPPPFMEWQTGQYERFQAIHHHFTIPFLLICKLLETPPEKIFHDLEEALFSPQHPLLQYILAQGYGRQRYSPVQITTMLAELKALSMLFPHGAPELMENFATWRDQYYRYWFNKWNQSHPLK